MAYASAIASILGTLVSTGASAYGASQSGKGGASQPFPTSPGVFNLRALFGGQNAQNIVNNRAQSGNSPFGNLTQQVYDYVNHPTSFGPGGPGILSSVIGDPTQYLENFNKSLGFLDQAVGTAAEANQTGLKTNGDAYFNEAIRRYMNEALPAAAETAGLGVTSTGFQAAASRASEDLLGQASLANIDLQEAANNRRLQAAPLLQGLTAARQALPLNLANQLSSLYNFEARKPLDTYQQLYALSNGAQYAAPSYSPTDTSAATTAALVAGLGQLSSNLSGLYNNYSTRNSSTSTLNPQNWAPLADTNNLGP